MSIRLLSKNHSSFEDNIKNLITYGLEIIHEDSPKTSREEKAMLLEALLLRSCALWENFVEKEIVLAIKLNSAKFKHNLGLPANTKLTVKLIRAILYSDRYQDYHDIERSRGYLRKILSHEQNPFESVTKERRERISFTFKIRNYLSHYSDYSRKKLLEAYEKHHNLKRFTEPGVFLLKGKGAFFEKLIHNFILVSVSMKKMFRSN